MSTRTPSAALAGVAALALTATAQMSGTYTVNPALPPSASNFQTLAAACAALAGGVSGPVFIEVYDDGGPYTEVVPCPNLGALWPPSDCVLKFAQWPGVSAANRVTFRAGPGEHPELDATGRALAVYWDGADHVTLEGFDIHDPIFDAINMYSNGSTGQVIAAHVIGNVIHDIPGGGVVIYGNSPSPTDTLVANNVFYSCVTNLSGSFQDATRFSFIGTRRDIGTRIVHNTFYADAFDQTPPVPLAILASWQTAPGLPWAECSNNIFFKTSTSAALLRFRSGPATVPALSDGNLYWDTTGGMFAVYDSAPDNPDLASWQVQTGLDAGSLVADPTLVDPGGARDFHLAAGSPAVNLGVTLQVPVTVDFEGDPRDASPDSGADEISASIVTVDTAPTQVAPGQTGIAVTMTAENRHPTEDLSVTTVGLSFTGQADRTSEYTVVPAPGNPTLVASGGGTATFDFTVDVSVSATEETITVDGSLDGTFLPSGIAISIPRSQAPDQWDVLGARPEARTVDAVPPQVAQGSTGNVVHVDVENVGLTDWIPGALTLSFLGQADRTSEYTVTPDPGNPVLLPSGATDTFTVSVDVSPAASLETITIDVAQLDGTDALTGRAQGDTGADTPDTWDVMQCGASLCGDCDQDGFVTILDALVAAQHSALIITVSGVQFTNCNVAGVLEPNPGAVVDIIDALTIAQWAALIGVNLVCC